MGAVRVVYLGSIKTATNIVMKRLIKRCMWTQAQVYFSHVDMVFSHALSCHAADIWFKPECPESCSVSKVASLVFASYLKLDMSSRRFQGLSSSEIRRLRGLECLEPSHDSDGEIEPTHPESDSDHKHASAPPDADADAPPMPIPSVMFPTSPPSAPNPAPPSPWPMDLDDDEGPRSPVPMAPRKRKLDAMPRMPRMRRMRRLGSDPESEPHVSATRPPPIPLVSSAEMDRVARAVFLSKELFRLFGPKENGPSASTDNPMLMPPMPMIRSASAPLPSVPVATHGSSIHVHYGERPLFSDSEFDVAGFAHRKCPNPRVVAQNRIKEKAKELAQRAKEVRAERAYHRAMIAANPRTIRGCFSLFTCFYFASLIQS